jgi:hypothetical protein
MIVLTIVTFGLYYPIWFLRRRAALNRLDSPRKLRHWPFLVFIAFVVLQVLVGLASGSAPREQTIGAGADLVLTLLQLAVGILMVVQCFFIKDILEDHLAGPEDSISPSILVDRVKLSGLMTFFFQIFYLQYVINRYVAVNGRLTGAGAVAPSVLCDHVAVARGSAPVVRRIPCCRIQPALTRQ